MRRVDQDNAIRGRDDAVIGTLQPGFNEHVSRELLHRSPSTVKIRNPKHEIPNKPHNGKSEIRISKFETNRSQNKFKIRKIQNSDFDPSRLEHWSCFVFHYFEFVSSFVLRISCLLFWSFGFVSNFEIRIYSPLHCNAHKFPRLAQIHRATNPRATSRSPLPRSWRSTSHLNFPNL